MKVRKELWFGLSIMALILLPTVIFMPWGNLTNGHLGLMMLALVVVAIMMGFPTAFTLMGMGMLFTWLAYRSVDPNLAVNQTLDLMVQRAFAVMTNDVLISIPLFVFMGYLVERANLIEKLFKSLHLALARVPGSLAVATLFTCAVFATATGIVGAVVTLMGLLAYPAMLRAGYDPKVGAGAITAGGCLGILIPPSVLLIVYGATAGVSVVKLYAGALIPGVMLALLYVAYVIVLAKLKPSLMPPLTAEQRLVPLPPVSERLRSSFGNRALPALMKAMKGQRNADVPTDVLTKQAFAAFAPALFAVLLVGATYWGLSNRTVEAPLGDLVEMGSGSGLPPGVVEEAPYGSSGGAQEPPTEGGAQLPPGAEADKPAAAQAPAAGSVAEPGAAPAAEAKPLPMGFWIFAAIMAAAIALYWAKLTWARLEILKMLLSSFFPLAFLILAVLGSIVLGLATPTEAAAIGSFGGFILAAAYKQLNYTVVKESAFLTAKTSAMVCWLFVGSSIFSAAFALLGGQELVEQWVLGLGLTKIQFLLLSQAIIFVLGWPLEWTEIIVIFMPIFVPLLDNFGVDPLFFGLLVALNLQTAFLSPPVAMAAFYLKGVSPPHITLNQIFAGMVPFMVIQVVALAILYLVPGIGLWLPEVLYK